MPAATLTIPPSVEHVRTARLVAVAAARRAGLQEELVDDVRLAVGEAVARAVLRHGAGQVDAGIDVVVRDGGDRFEVEVRDGCDPLQPDEDGGVALALVESVVPEIRRGDRLVVLVWPRVLDVAGAQDA